MGRLRKWNDSSISIILLGDSVLNGNGMVSDPFEKKGLEFFLNLTHFQHWRIQNLFFLLVALISPETERNLPRPFTEPIRSLQRLASLSRFAVDS